MKNKITQVISEIKKELYLKESIEYFDKNGFAKSKISDIAKQLDTSVGTIYNIFNSKEELYLEYLIFKLKIFIDALHENQTNNAKDNLAFYLKYKYEAIINNESNPLSNDPYFFHKLDIISHPIVNEIYSYLENQFEQLSTDERVSNKHLAILFKKFSDGFIESYIIKSYPSDDITNLTLEMFFNGFNHKNEEIA
jgi:AcrR family transcriptional regulator